jgi:hypothetical protein
MALRDGSQTFSGEINGSFLLSGSYHEAQWTAFVSGAVTQTNWFGAGLDPENDCSGDDTETLSWDVTYTVGCDGTEYGIEVSMTPSDGGSTIGPYVNNPSPGDNLDTVWPNQNPPDGDPVCNYGGGGGNATLSLP